jgi:hypothetical protein
MRKKMRKDTDSKCVNLDGLSRILPTLKICVLATRDFGARFERRNRSSVGFVRLEAVSIAQYERRIQGSVDRDSREVHHASGSR